ncbi:terminase family protein [Albimonas sp. CAU 1670]|uniref:terminase large subunit domain-containing protein n=1 Tax=Albimonas sp. CAU 1670 TaxID=3032599 RepID=UPI0023DB301A|nr:terminase family protein [Albimonas sp. CAU 1670]MDF2232186.1 terminase family protein [Albimonas sp. CAU 1670]
MNAPISREDWERQRREATEAMPSLVAEVGLPKVLLAYQAKTVHLLDTAAHRVLVIEKSRRVGVTWALAAYAVLRAGREKPAGGMDAMYISYSQEMTREFVDACAMWARAFAMASFETEDFLFPDGDAEGDRSIQAFRIRFASGFEIIALSSAPRSLRGKQGVVIIDEAAFVESLPELLKAALAFLMWGGQVVVCSTHNGAENPFNELVQDVLSGRKPYAHERIDLDQALRDGLYQRICLVTGTEWSPEAEADWRQDIIDFYAEGADEELFCIPSMGSGAWLPAPLIEARMTAEAPVLRLELPANFLQLPTVERLSLLTPFMEELETALAALDLSPRFAFGFDFGRVADLTVAVLLAIEQNLRRREALSIELRGVPGHEQKAIVRMVLEHVRARLLGAAFDATGMGWTVAEDMGRLFGLREGEEGSGLVMAIKFTEDWYRQHMPPVKAAFEDDMIALSPDEHHLSDLRTVKLIRGVPRVPPTREGEKGKKRHGDYAIGLALAHFASRQRWVEYGYTPVGRSPDRSRGEMHDLPDERGPGRSWWKPPLGGGLRGGF